jgi:DNA polymerase-3 subunit delta
VILAFTGDPFLAREGLLQEARLQGLSPRLLPPQPALVAQEASGGLFGPSGALVDLREIGEAEWKPLRELLDSLPSDALVLLLDPRPTAARSKWYGKDRLRDHPAPKGRDLARWLENRARAAGYKLPSPIAHYLSELVAGKGSAENPMLGLEALEQEVAKLALVPAPLTLEKAQQLVAIDPPPDGFALVRNVTEGRAREAFRLTHRLMAMDEDPLRILGALSWQYSKLALAWGYLQEQPGLGEGDAASLLGVHPYAAKQTLALAHSVQAEVLEQALEVLLEAEQAAKTGRDPRLALERAVAGLLALARRK